MKYQSEAAKNWMYSLHGKILRTLFTVNPERNILRLSAATQNDDVVEAFVETLFLNFKSITKRIGDFRVGENFRPLKEKLSPWIYKVINEKFDKVELKEFKKNCSIVALELILDCCILYCEQNKNGNKNSILRLLDIDNNIYTS